MKATFDDNNNNKNVVNKNNKEVNNNNVNINSAYKRFQSAVSLERLNTKSGHLISYYDYGPKSKDMPPLVCIHGIASNPGIFFKQIVSLAARGYRVLSFSLPIVYDQQVCTNILNEYSECSRKLANSFSHSPYCEKVRHMPGYFFCGGTVDAI